MSLLKIPVLLSGTVGFFTSLTPPQPKVPASERPKDTDALERFIAPITRLYAGSFRFLICAGSLLETAVILASRYPAHPLSQTILEALVYGPASLASKIDFSPPFLLGAGLATVGGLVRLWCYRTLGRFFTVEVAIKGDHELVTSGPYAYVRHPSYTGGLASLYGIGICYASRGSWLRECRIWDTPWGRAAMALWVVHVVIGTAVALKRPSLEDALLKERFGDQWDQWARRVPYKFVPYIY